MAQLRSGTSWARLWISRAVLDRDGHTFRHRGQLADTQDNIIAKINGGERRPEQPGGLLSRLPTASVGKSHSPSRGGVRFGGVPTLLA